MDEIPRGVAISIENAGWKPGKRIAEGGGGTVFACFPQGYIDIYESLMDHVRKQVQVFSSGTPQFAVQMGNQLISENLSLTPLVGAVKIPHAITSETSEKIDIRLKEEIRAMASFSHPNLIRLLSYDSTDTPRWFIMDFYRKGTLEHNKHVFKGNPLRALEALRPIVEGVSQLHSHSTVHIHRDIKPKNVFVSDSGQLVLGDFGIVFTKAEDRTRLTKPGDAPYSRDWIPEWVRHRSLDDFSPKVDVYMLAKVLYFMLANTNVLPSQLDDKDFNLEKLFPDVKGIGGVYDLLTTCIVSKEAECQPKDAGELLARIDEVITQIHGKNSCLLFNFLCATVNSGLELPKDFGFGVRSLTDVQVYLPAPGKEFIAKARIWSPSEGAAAEIGFNLEKANSSPVRVRTSATEPGSWSGEILLRTPKPLNRGWHSLRVNGNSLQHQSILTGFMLYAI